MSNVSETSFVLGTTKTYNKRAITSLHEYIDYVSFIQRWWQATDLWFRGVSKCSYRLEPSLYRQATHDNARLMCDEFIRRAKATDRIASFPKTRWEWYQIMQHHGLPTRLLDWSTGSLIAAYFSLRNLKTAKSPAVWVLEPNWVNESSQDLSGIYYTDRDIQSDGDKITELYLDYHSDEPDSPKLPTYPIAVAPGFVNARISAQKSAFTVHGSAKYGLEALYRKTSFIQLAQLRFSNRHIKRIKNDLLKTGITESVLFPDLEGLAREIQWEYGF